MTARGTPDRPSDRCRSDEASGRREATTPHEADAPEPVRPHELRPPLLGRLMLRLCRLGTRREEIESDLRQLFEERAAVRGYAYASLRYCLDAASLRIHRTDLRHRSLKTLPAVRRLRLVDTIAVDLRSAVRMLRTDPLLTAAVVVTLSIGIGAPSSVFSLLNGFVFRAPVTADPDAFFRVARADREPQGIVTPPQYDVLREENESARELAAFSTMALSAPLGVEDPTDVPGWLVSCNFFRVFGVDRAMAGRLLGPEDCTAGLPVAVISESLWQHRFAGDPSVVGTSVMYGAVPVTIVGVAPVAPIQRRAHDPTVGDFVAHLWVPYTAHPAFRATSTFEGLLLRDTFPWLELAGLLEPGISRQAATNDLRLIASRHEELFDPSPERALILTDGSRWEATPGDMLSAFAMALSLPALILLAACVNVAALLLSRAVSRQREMALRLALGTSRAALLRMLLLLESLVVSGLAAAASLVFVYNLPPLLVRFFEADLWFGAADSLAPDGRVLAFLMLSGVLAALLSGVAPALESLNPHLAEALQGRRGFVSRRGPSRTRRLFVAVQVAASVVLLVAAASFSRAAARFTDRGSPPPACSSPKCTSLRTDRQRSTPSPTRSPRRPA